MSTTNTLCFAETAAAYASNAISLSQYNDNHLAHFQGIRHPFDEQYNSPEVPDIVSRAMKVFIKDKDFQPIKDVKPLHSLILAISAGDLPVVQSLTPLVHQTPELLPLAPLLIRLLTIIAIQSLHFPIITYLISSSLYHDQVFAHHDRLAWDLRDIIKAHASPQLLELTLQHGYSRPDLVLQPDFRNNDLAMQMLNHDSRDSIDLLKVLLIQGERVRLWILNIVVGHGSIKVLQFIVTQYTAEDLAAYRPFDSSVKRIQCLLDAGLDINYLPPPDDVERMDPRSRAEVNSFPQQKAGTALHMAAMYGRIEIARYLLEKGARTDIKDEIGRTAAMVASDFDTKDVKSLIEEYSGGK